MGTYRVIKVKHEIDQNHRYRGEFEAVAASMKHTPTPELKVPAAGPVSAVVVSNKDPQGMGRIWVDFPFARERRNEVWLRVMTPDAGSSGEVGKNRGMVFIPEAGDQVMVGFEFGDPNRPYVMGSLFHGKNAAGGGANNAIKSIITRSGIKIVFNDDAKSLHIEDPSGNSWDMDGKGNIAVNAPGNITIDAGETVMLNAKNLEINIEEDVVTMAGKNRQIGTGEKLEISAKTLEEKYAEDATTGIGGKHTVQTGDTELLSDSDVLIKGTGNALVQGGKDARISKG
jgi:uncharacterized protein involved in type VI secretion and phage assembly